MFLLGAGLCDCLSWINSGSESRLDNGRVFISTSNNYGNGHIPLKRQNAVNLAQTALHITKALERKEQNERSI